MSVVLDASAVLAFLKSEPGADLVQQHLRRAGLSAVNLIEVLEKSMKAEGQADRVLRLLRGYQVEFVAFDDEQARMAASIKQRIGNADLSLADRACLALAAVRKQSVLTADRLWASQPTGVDVILVRGVLN